MGSKFTRHDQSDTPEGGWQIVVYVCYSCLRRGDQLLRSEYCREEGAGTSWLSTNDAQYCPVCYSHNISPIESIDISILFPPEESHSLQPGQQDGRSFRKQRKGVRP